MSKRYNKSEKMLARALKTIPLGSQTFSKSKIQYPYGVSPYFIKNGKGSRVWDIDGNEYVDFVNGLLSINLGYNDPDINQAVKSQLDEGVIFTLPHPVEAEVAEKLVEMVPCAEMVRFGKNGSDVTAGAIRLARAYTGRDRVAVCGYHGWQDWYIGSTTRNKGVPEVVRDLTHGFQYNDLASLESLFSKHYNQFAAVILEPMNTTEPDEGFLEAVKNVTHRNGALLIFDEMITGFRYANGGGQEYFGVTPDLATFGKGMANGHPLSAIVGRTEIMKLMEEIFFSFTFGGETLSLAAGLATMRKIQTQPVIETIFNQGTKVIKGISGLIQRHKLSDTLQVIGHPSWSFLTINDTGQYGQWDIKTLLLQEMFLRGILTIGTHNMSYAHSDSDVEKLLSVYDEVFPVIHEAIHAGTLKEKLHCEVLEPLFKIR